MQILQTIPGSPPPMRGKGLWIFCKRFERGITPAYAGKSERGYDKFTEIGDHPRLCGEKRRFPNVVTHVRGSPPPMRGKVGLLVLSLKTTRITPAYAGKSGSYTSNKIVYRDHPRLCGEKYFCTVCIMRTKGSPPPMRGKVSFRFFYGGILRITPAYAGKSKGFKEWRTVKGDHPRLCGEKAFFNAFIFCS